MNNTIKKILLWVSGGMVLTISFLIFVLPYFSKAEYSVYSPKESKIEFFRPGEPVETAMHIETPEPLKALYMTACVASTPSWRNNLRELINTTELNAVVIDIKDSTGSISFVDDELQKDHGKGCVVKDLKEFIEELHQDGIYVIGRVSVFQDPLYTKLHPDQAVKSKSTGGVWKDRKGLSFVDVGAKDFWDHIVKISIHSYELGFDEINFDYIRYPTDGDVKDAHYSHNIGTSTRVEMLEKFFAYLHKETKDTDMKTSADLFGLTTVAKDDLGIGQVMEKTLPYFDYVYPMVYPSHFGPGSAGYQKPGQHPYEIIKYSMDGALAKEKGYRIMNGLSTSTPSQIRPWLQDFDLGGTYGVAEVRAQIKATYDVGLNSWLVWDAGNKYTPGAFLTE